MNKKLIILIMIFIIILTIGIGTFYLFSNKEGNEDKVNNEQKDNVNINLDSSQKNMDSSIINNENQKGESMEMNKINLSVNNRNLTATLNDNSSAKALIEELKKGSIVINMSDYASMEKVGTLGFNLPKNDENITTDAGDLILYQGNSFVIYYDKNNWSLTRLGKIDNISASELKSILGSEDVTVILSLN